MEVSNAWFVNEGMGGVANARLATEIPEKEEAAADLSDLAGCEIRMTLE